jgi:hypothetical protein
MSVFKHNLVHTFIRWGLGIHGSIHLLETVVNIYEGAWISASLSALASFLMLGGACIDITHHSKDQDEGR